MTQLLVGTKKGLFVLDGEPGGPFEVSSRAFAGEPVEFAFRDPRTGRNFSCLTSAFYGPKLFYTDDLSAEWQQAEGIELPEDAEKAMTRLWVVTPGEEDGLLYAGGDPGVLFESRDGGETWELNKAFWEQPTRPDWSPGAGGMCMHSIATWPGDPSRIALAISAVGVWLSDDGGRRGGTGTRAFIRATCPRRHGGHDRPLRPQHAPRAVAARAPLHAIPRRRLPVGRCRRELGVDRRRPPSDFGFPMVLDPEDPDSAYVIPLVADLDRTTPEGKVRVYETRDAGKTWIERGDGLPADDAYLTILRQAFARDGSGKGMGLYFGATSGDVFGSKDAGATWFTAATNLPPVHSVRVA